MRHGCFAKVLIVGCLPACVATNVVVVDQKTALERQAVFAAAEHVAHRLLERGFIGRVGCGRVFEAGRLRGRQAHAPRERLHGAVHTRQVAVAARGVARAERRTAQAELPSGRDHRAQT